MPTITEGSLAFDFPANWQVTKYDEWAFYVNRFQNTCNGAKGVDILALNPSKCLWLIEIKDYRAEPRQKSIELAQEFSEKIRDTLAALFAARLQANVEHEKTYAASTTMCSKMNIVLHLEQPAKPSRLHPIEDVSKLLLKIKQLLRAIDQHPRIASLTDGNRFGWSVREV